MDEPRLLPSQLRALLAKYDRAPGIRRGIIAEHVARGGDSADAAPSRTDLDDIFGDIFGRGVS